MGALTVLPPREKERRVSRSFRHPLENATSAYSVSANWSARHERAAFLVASDHWNDDRIARDVGVHPATLCRWKRDEAFRARVALLRERLLEHVWTAGIAQKARRITILDGRHRGLEDVIAERSEWFAAEAPEVPGGKSGLIARHVKVDPQGNEVVEYAVDVALLREERRILEHVAREKGEWVEKNVSLTANVDLNDDDLDPAVLAAVRQAMTGQAAQLGMSASLPAPAPTPGTSTGEESAT